MQWDSGYRGQVIVANTASVSLTVQRLVFQVPGATLNSADEGQASQVGDTVTVVPAADQATIAPGEHVDLGFVFTGTAQNPTGCVLNGQPCTFLTPAG
jgi:Cellulose binding domain